MDEIKALREEVAKLRERIAVLEASTRPQYAPCPSLQWPAYQNQPPQQWVYPTSTSIQPHIAPNSITC